MKRNGLKMLVLAGLAGSVASVANAQPYVINITGATLLENYVIAPASTNDYMDVDGDGIAGRFGNGIDQLAPVVSGAGTPVFAAGTRWLVHYRNIGSISGLNELVRTGRTWVTSDWADLNGIPGTNNTTTKAFYNRTQFINNNALISGTFGNTLNPGGFAWRSPQVADFVSRTVVFGNNASQGLHADIAVADVPALWGVISPNGTARFDRKPGQAGYGDNARTAVANDGSTPSGNVSARLVNASSVNLYDGVPANANTNTLFDNPLAFAPIATFTNIGTGVEQIDQSDLRHIYATGRLMSGENLTAVTRDTGSGTRNGHNNSIGLDPSFGVGESVGAENSSTANELVGNAYLPSNKTGSSNLERTLRNTRLGFGYSGAERFVNSGLNGANFRLEIMAVRNDLMGGTVFARPTVTTVFDNSADGWVIGGPASLITFGDPRAESVAAGGLGLATPRMRNPEAAAYLNNLRQSIDAFVSVPGDAGNLGMPGEFAATQFILLAGIDQLQSPTDPLTLVPNPALNQTLQDTLKGISVYANGAFASFDSSQPGRVPQRRDAATGFAGNYSDARNATYVNQAGVNVSYGAAVPARNKIAGDFDNNGERNVADATGLIAAWRDRAGLGAWDGVGANGGASDTTAVIELLGDFNNDGNFDSADVRYFADGLAIATTGGNAGKLDRKAGFIAVDNASLALGGAVNFFGTSKATGAAYAAGDSRGDIAKAKVSGAFRSTPGYAPVGHDGAVNGWDICYVYKQFAQNPAVTDGALNWSNTAEAVGGDLSADINGDLVINQADVDELVQGVLGTTMGDVNLDGQQNAADVAIVNANLGTTGACWQDGDLNGDGTVTAADLAIAEAGVRCGLADVGGQGGTVGFDGQLDNNDFVVFIDLFFNQQAGADLGSQGGVVGSDGQFDNNDFVVFIDLFFQGCN